MMPLKTAMKPNGYFTITIMKSYTSIQRKKVKSITPLDFRGKKLIALKITERNDSSFVFYSIPDFEAGYETPDLPYQAKVEDNLLIFYKKNSTFAVQASKIVNLDTGKTIYEPDASKLVFTSIREA
jgi:hypothetical protein